MSEVVSSGSVPQTTKRTIVIIDPSLTMRTVLAITMQAQGYAVVSYASPALALAALRQQRIAWPALVLLSEHTQPFVFGDPPVSSSLDGWEVLHLLEQWDLPLRTIFLLDKAGLLSPIKARLAGACATLSKPFRIQHLIALVQRYGRP